MRLPIPSRGRALSLAILFALAAAPATAQLSVLFDFNDAPIHASLPLDLTVAGVTAHLSATGQGFSIQDPSSSIGLVPAGFSGLAISPNSIFPADLLVGFGPMAITDFSILYAPQELATDSSATMRVTAYYDGTFVGTATATAANPGTWPSQTLAITAPQGFNRVVVHYDSPPPTGGDYGPIFVADDMGVTTVPEPSTAPSIAWGLAGLLGLGRKRAAIRRSRA